MEKPIYELTMSDLTERLDNMLPEDRDQTLRFLPSYLARSNLRMLVSSLLTNFAFIQAKLDALGPQLLIDDYDLSDEASLRFIQRVLRQESHILSEYPDLLWQQTYNRLQWETESAIQQLVKHWGNQRVSTGQPWFYLDTPLYEPLVLIRTLSGHSEWINDCALSHDNSFIVSAGKDHTIKIWDAHTGDLRNTLYGHTDIVRCCAISPDDSFIVSASDDQTIRIWDTQTGKEQTTLPSNAEIVSACAISPDGAFIVSGGLTSDKPSHTLIMRDVRSKQIVLTLSGHTEWIRDCTFSTDGSLLLSASSDNTLIVWDTARGKIQSTLRGHTNSVNACALSLDNSFIVSASSDKTLKVWNTSTGQLKATLTGHLEGVVACAISPDSSFIISGCIDGTLKVWNAQTGHVRATLLGHISRVTACTISSDGAIIISSSWDNTIKLWDTALLSEKNLSNEMILYRSVYDCSFSSDGSFFITIGEEGTLKIWDTATQKERAVLSKQTVRISSCAMSPDGAFIVSESSDGALSIWDTQSYQERTVPRLSPASTNTIDEESRKDSYYEISPDSKLIIFSAQQTDILRVLDVGTLQEVASLPKFDKKCAISPDASFIVYTCFANDRLAKHSHYFTVWNIQKRQEYCRFIAHLVALAISPNNSFILFVEKDSPFIVILDAHNGQVRTILQGHRHSIAACTFSPDSTLVASTSLDQTFKLWDVTTGELKASYPNLIGLAWASENYKPIFSPDGKFILFSSFDRKLTLWDLENERECGIFPLRSSLKRIHFHPWKPRVICTDTDNNFYFIELIGITYKALIVTPFTQGNNLIVQCPKCQNLFSIIPDELGHETLCQNSECGAHLRVNPYLITMHSSSWFEALPTIAEEKEEPVNDASSKQISSIALFDVLPKTVGVVTTDNPQSNKAIPADERYRIQVELVIEDDDSQEGKFSTIYSGWSGYGGTYIVSEEPDEEELTEGFHAPPLILMERTQEQLEASKRGLYAPPMNLSNRSQNNALEEDSQQLLREQAKLYVYEARLREGLEQVSNYVERHDGDQQPIIVRIALLLELSTMLNYQGRHQEAQSLYEEYLQKAQTQHDKLGQAVSWEEFGRSLLMQEEYTQASSHFTRALDLFRELNEIASVAQVLHLLGWIAYKLENLAEAERHYRESFEFRKQLGDEASLIASYNQLASVAQQSGRLAEAEGLYRGALKFSEQGYSTPSDYANVLSNLAILLAYEVQKGHIPMTYLAEACGYVERALAIENSIEHNIDLEGSLDQILAQGLEPEVYRAYTEAKQRHFREWKYYRTSDQQTLQFLRKLLYQSSVLKLNRESGWKINRSYSEYVELFGTDFFAKIKTNVKELRSSGKSDPEESFLQADSGPGNCRALYESAMPGVTGVGWGIEILFSVDGTLVNCLKEEFQFDNDHLQDGYFSPYLFRSLKALEILSVFEFLVSEQISVSHERYEAAQLFNLLASLCQSQQTIPNASVLEKLERDAQNLMLRIRTKTGDMGGKDAVVAIMLGFLIDELVSRLYVPNGMGFWYRSMEAVLVAISQNYHALRSTITSAGIDADELEKDINITLLECLQVDDTDTATQQVWERKWIRKTETIAEKFRHIGFTARQGKVLKDEDVTLFFTIANELWRWVYFLEHREVSEKEFNDRQRMAEIVLRWLRRPWGIVSTEDIEYVYRGLIPGDETDEVPRAFSALIDFLRSEMEIYFPVEFGFKGSAQSLDYCKRFIERRLTLTQARRNIVKVRVDNPVLVKESSRAKTIIDLLTMWLYDPRNKGNLDKIEQDLDELEKLLRNGAWLQQYQTEKQFAELLTKKQIEGVRLYLKNPSGFVSRLFRFGSPDFEIGEHLDIFPPEEFKFGSLEPIPIGL